MTSDTIRISEIFGPTIQGEGALIGQATIFVRTGGCDYRCTWCDTLHAVKSEFRHSWTPMSAQDIWKNIETLSGKRPLVISLSGGNPATQNLKPLIDLGHAKNYLFALETQGSIAQDWFADLDILTLSPKPPSSDMGTDWHAFDECLNAARQNKPAGPEIALKIVVFDETDYAYAKDAAARYPSLPIYLQPGNHKTEGEADTETLNTQLKWLAEEVTKDSWFNARVLPQLHVMIWGNAKGV